MEDKSGANGLLSFSWIYEIFQNLLGAKRVRRWLAGKYWKLKGGEKVIDIGCGPGVVFSCLPDDVNYIGFDIDEKYIRAATKKFGKKAEFILCSATDFLDKLDGCLAYADLILCNGLLHHLDDREATDVLKQCRQIMGPQSRLVCFEPVTIVHQRYFERWIMKRDRGNYIRTEKEWKTLVSSVFDFWGTDITTGLLLIPYSHIVIECRKENYQIVPKA